MVLTSVRLPANHAPLGLILWYHTCELKTETPIVLSDEHLEYIWADAQHIKAMTSADDLVAPHLFNAS
ncbi:MAG: hypothetical protein V4482_03320 [Pseudomonadota bacterium]